MTALEEILNDLYADLELAKEIIASSPGPLDEPPKSQAAAALSSAQTHISSALAQINNVGTADATNLPTTLPGIASECLTLADCAQRESQISHPDLPYIGSKIKTIDRIITVSNGYRAKAGIT